MVRDGFLPSGIWPIVYAFFGPDGGLDRAAMRRQARACVAAGAPGIAALGLATEVEKLSPGERHRLMAWLLADVGGAVPVAVTVFGETPAAQIAFIRAAADLGAACAILQPPPTRPLAEADLARFFADVAEAAPIPLGIQNAPQYLGVGLSPAAVLALCRDHANIVLLKAETSALEIADLVAALGSRVCVFNGRGGLELPDCLRAGGAGLIPAPECLDVQLSIWAAMQANDEAHAEELYAGILPLTVFTMQSVAQLRCYGKRLLARRLGLGPVVDRPPFQAPTALGLAALDRHAASLGPLPHF